ncbi:MAG: hypothetical protein D6737_20200, partial [Chloroflexi bacterium]
MTLRDIIDVFPQVIGGLLAVALLLFLISLQQLRVGRTGSYWRQRRNAGTRGGRLFLFSTGLFIFAAAAGLFFVLGLLATGRTDLLFGREGLVGVVLPTPTPQGTNDSPPFATITVSPTPVPTLIPQTPASTTPPTSTAIASPTLADAPT